MCADRKLFTSEHYAFALGISKVGSLHCHDSQPMPHVKHNTRMAIWHFTLSSSCEHARTGLGLANAVQLGIHLTLMRGQHCSPFP